MLFATHSVLCHYGHIHRRSFLGMAVMIIDIHAYLSKMTLLTN